MEHDYVINGRYRVVDVLGAGGMARVYKATDERLGRLVAVKTLYARYNDQPDFVARFVREARLAARLSHPNIISVYDVGHDDDGTHYIVMEYVAGEILKSVIRREAPLSLPAASAICQQICLALDYAHQHGVIHRDIKPENVFFTPSHQVKVGDFGIARAHDSTTITAPGMVLGSISYLSPEQAQGQPVTAVSDLYSLGIVLYEMLTGRVPFVADNDAAVVMKHLTEAPSPPSLSNPRLPAGVDAVVLKALAKDPAQRHRSGAELVSALERAHSDDALFRPAAPPRGLAAVAAGQRAAVPAEDGIGAIARARRLPAGRHGPASSGRDGRLTARAPVRPPSARRHGALLPIALVLLLLAGGIAVVHSGLGAVGRSPAAATATVAGIAHGGVPLVRSTSTPAATPTTARNVPIAAAPAATTTPTPSPPATTPAGPTPSTTPALPTATVAVPTPTAIQTVLMRLAPIQSATPAVSVVQVTRPVTSALAHYSHLRLTLARGVRDFAPVDPTHTFDVRAPWAYAIAHWHRTGSGHSLVFVWITPAHEYGRYAPACGGACGAAYAMIPLSVTGTYHVAVVLDNSVIAADVFTAVSPAGRPRRTPSVAGALGSSQYSKAAVQLDRAVRAAVLYANDVYMQVMNTGDTSRLARAFGPRLTDVNRRVAALLKAKRQHWQIRLLRMTLFDVTVLTSGTAEVRVVKTESARLLSDSGAVVADRGTYTVSCTDILQRMDRRWVVDQVAC